MEKTFLVITSIAPSSKKALQSFASECKKNEVHMIVIGDKKSPANFQINDIDYYSLDTQKKLNLSISKILPENKYSRKNIGYLIAMQAGATTIIESDDDNHPEKNFWTLRSAKTNAYLFENSGWVNVYKYFSKLNIWPRGFNLECLQNYFPIIENNKTQEVYCPIQQGLVNLNPDVDSIYRLVFPLPVSFDHFDNVALGKGTICPFNSQNTTWFHDAFMLMYLPTFCNFRMTDIWRSFIAQRIAWENNWSVLFHNATVNQERNEHTLLKDFEDEIPGYLNNGKFFEILSTLSLKTGANFLSDNLYLCYEALVKEDLIAKEEIQLLESWILDCKSILK